MIQVYSEIDKLEKVILHRPGRELLNLAPDMLEELLFDEIPYLEKAQEEHDKFKEIFEKNSVEVLYLEDLAAEAIESESVKNEFIKEFILESKIYSPSIEKRVYDLLNEMDNKSLILKAMEGIRKEEISVSEKSLLTDFCFDDPYFITKPMPNLYFTRDPFSLIGNGISLNHMWSEIRNRETIFGKYIFKYHPNYKTDNFLYNRDILHSIEGGDQLIINSDTLAIGISQRTSARACEIFSENVLKNTSFKQVLAFVIPKKRAFMHLDTVFTMIDKDKFTVHPNIEGPLEVYKIFMEKDEIKVEKMEGTLEHILSKALNRDDIKLIRCGGGHPLDAAREQWSDGSNTLAIAPGEVIVYDRNTVTNELLEKNGVKIHVMVSGELSRGRGGPRCMSMPYRRSIK